MDVKLEVQCRTRLATAWVRLCYLVHLFGRFMFRERWVMRGAQNRVALWAVRGYYRLVRVRSRIEGQKTWGRWERVGTQEAT